LSYTYILYTAIYTFLSIIKTETSAQSAHFSLCFLTIATNFELSPSNVPKHHQHAVSNSFTM
jgi:hypothetical protein